MDRVAGVCDWFVVNGDRPARPAGGVRAPRARAARRDPRASTGAAAGLGAVLADPGPGPVPAAAAIDHWESRAAPPAARAVPGARGRARVAARARARGAGDRARARRLQAREHAARARSRCTGGRRDRRDARLGDGAPRRPARGRRLDHEPAAPPRAPDPRGLGARRDHDALRGAHRVSPSPMPTSASGTCSRTSSSRSSCSPASVRSSRAAATGCSARRTPLSRSCSTSWRSDVRPTVDEQLRGLRGVLRRRWLPRSSRRTRPTCSRRSSARSNDSRANGAPCCAPCATSPPRSTACCADARAAVGGARTRRGSTAAGREAPPDWLDPDGRPPPLRDPARACSPRSCARSAATPTALRPGRRPPPGPSRRSPLTRATREADHAILASDRDRVLGSAVRLTLRQVVAMACSGHTRRTPNHEHHGGANEGDSLGGARRRGCGRGGRRWRSPPGRPPARAHRRRRRRRPTSGSRPPRSTSRSSRTSTTRSSRTSSWDRRTRSRASATYINNSCKQKNNCLAGRKVVVDFYDSKFNPNETTNAEIEACQNDVAMVGTSAVFLTPSTTCATARTTGAATGLPDIPFVSTALVQQCSDESFPMAPPQVICSTKDQHPQTFQPTSGARSTTTRSSARTCTASTSSAVTRSRPVTPRSRAVSASSGSVGVQVRRGLRPPGRDARSPTSRRSCSR